MKLVIYRFAVLVLVAIALVLYRKYKRDSLALACAQVAATLEVGFLLVFLAAEHMRTFVDMVAATIGVTLKWSVHRASHAYDVALVVEGVTVGIVALVLIVIWERFFSRAGGDLRRLKILYLIPVLCSVAVGVFGYSRDGTKMFFVFYGWVTIILSWIWWCSRTRFEKREVARASLTALLIGVVVLSAVIAPEVWRLISGYRAV